MIILIKVIATIGLIIITGMILSLIDRGVSRTTLTGYRFISVVNVIAVAAIWIEDMYRCVSYLFT